jgi:hypothetical protein
LVSIGSRLHFSHRKIERLRYMIIRRSQEHEKDERSRSHYSSIQCLCSRSR